MIVIELAGLPGCGKSTLMKRINLNNDKIKFFDYHLMLGVWVSSNIRRNIAKILTAIFPFCWKFNKLLKKFSKEYSNVSSSTLVAFRVLYMQSKILPFFFPKSVAVLDEGFAQMITSVPHNENIKPSNAYNEFIDYIKKNHNIHVVDCDCSLDICIQRLRKRNGRDRFNSIKDDNILFNLLNQKRLNLSETINNFNCIYHINTESVTSEDLNLLLSRIQEVFK